MGHRAAGRLPGHRRRAPTTAPYAGAGRALAEIGASLVMARDARLSARVGVCVTMPEDLLARVDEILAGEQRLKIEFDEADSPEQLDLLRTGALSFGVIRVFRDEDGLAARTLADRPLGVVLRPDRPLTGHCVLSWADLADQELLWFPSSRNPNFSEGALGHPAERGWTPRLRIVDGHNHALYCRHLRSSPNWSRCGPRTPSAPRREWPGVRSRPTHRTNASSWPHRPTARGRLCSARSLTGPEYRRPQRTTVRAIVAWPPTRIRCSTPSW